MLLGFVILYYLAVTIVDYIPLIKKKEKKEIVIYSILFISSFILMILLVQNVKLPSPTNFIKFLLKPLIK